LYHLIKATGLPGLLPLSKVIRTGGKQEIEIKLKLDSAEQGRRLLRQAGFRVIRRRVHEENVLLDTRRGTLRKKGLLLRLRRAGRAAFLALKGPAGGGKYKSRLGLETVLSDLAVCEAVLGSLGFGGVFRYEKYRTEYQSSHRRGIVMLDETPIGIFLELEGEPGWINRTAELLGFEESHYITASYGQLHALNCRRQRRPVGDMLFITPAPSRSGGSGPKRVDVGPLI
jgi:adenylate cyclase, class 2